MTTPEPPQRLALGYVHLSRLPLLLHNKNLTNLLPEFFQAHGEPFGLECVGAEVDTELDGSACSRPGFTRALGRLEEGDAQVLIVESLEHLTRSLPKLGQLLSEHFGPEGHQLVSIVEGIDTASESGRLVVSVLGRVSGWGSELVSERVSKVMSQMKLEGKRTGYVSFGQKLADDGVHLVPDQDELEVLELIRTKKAEGLSLRGLADWLNEHGYENRGRAWNHMSVKTKLGQGLHSNPNDRRMI